MFSFCGSNGCKLRKLKDQKIASNDFIYRKSYNSNMSSYLKENDYKIDSVFDDLIANSDNRKQSSYSLDVESDTQYELNEVFFAEGNVIITFNNATLKADKVSFDKKTKIYIAKGNVIFEKANQYFRAEKIKYNFDTKKGELYKIYGVLEIDNLGKDFDYTIKEDEVCLNNIPSFLNPIREVELLETNNIRFINKKKLDALQFTFPSFTRWRFQSERINIDDNKWTSDQIFFTNDPYNKPQLIFESNDFTAEIFENKNKIKTRAGFLIFENKVRIPIGRRTINSNDGLAVWGIGIERQKKDGLYIFRNYETVKFNDYKLDLQPYFLLERSIKGKTKSFIAKDESINSSKVESNASFADLWALDVDLEGKVNEWNLNLDTNFHSLDINRFNETEASLTVSRKIFQFSKPQEIVKDSKDEKCSRSILLNQDNESERLSTYNLDFGFYSSYRTERDIYYSYGSKIISEYKTKKGRSQNEIYASLDYGKFNAEIKDHNDFANFNRVGFVTTLSNTYKIKGDIDYKNKISEEHKYTPRTVDNGIFLTTKLSGANYFYSNGDKQNGLSASFRPTFVYGELKRNFLDYTYLSLETEYALKSGQSPFHFDNLNSDARLSINFKQQIIGPLLGEVSGVMNINGSSSKFGKLEKLRYSAGISRRAYSLFFYFEPSREEIGFNIDIFDFNYKGRTDRIKD